MRDALASIRSETAPPAHLRDRLGSRGRVVRPQRLSAPRPHYPRFAREACIEGTVVLRALIHRDGSLSGIRVLRYVPGVTAAAVEAVRKWKFRPATLEGEPVRTYYNLAVNFRLDQECRPSQYQRNPWP